MSARALPPGSARHSRHTDPHPTILLVEDDPCLLGILTLELEAAGYRVRGFSSAEQALAAMGPEGADLAILDYCLPGMNGLALLKRLRRSWPDLPALIISSDCEAGKLPSRRGLPAARLLRKPFLLGHLLHHVQTLL